MEGLICGRYRITGKLGEGGMAEVYAATHELIGQEAVVKLLLPHMSAQQTILRRFLQEAQAAAAIKHPGIVSIYDVGTTEDGRAYIIMERLYGESLHERLQREGQLTVDDAKLLIRHLAGAMEAAHARNIIHRDLKPENLFVVADSEVMGGERIKVLDFGLAKLAADVQGTLLTAQGAVFGTPAYMAPEQCRDSGNVDGRADLYSIGCIFYRCLCGVPPFHDPDPLVMLRAHLSEVPEPPSARRPGVPAELDELVMRLLAKNPDDRVQSCTALIDALGGAVSLPEIVSEATRVVAATEVTMMEVVEKAVVEADSEGAAPGSSDESGDGSSVPKHATLVGLEGESGGDDGSSSDLSTLVSEAAAYDVPSAPEEMTLVIRGDQDDATFVGVVPGLAPVWVVAPEGSPGVVSRRGLRRLILAASGVVILVGLVLLAVFGGGTAEESGVAAGVADAAAGMSEAERDEHVMQARRALADRAWSRALEFVARAQAGGTGSAELEQIKQRAMAGREQQAALQRLQAAAAAADLDGVLEHMEKIPSGSEYAADAAQVLGDFADSLAARAVERAQEFVQRGDCAQLGKWLNGLAGGMPGVYEGVQSYRERCDKRPEVTMTPEKADQIVARGQESYQRGNYGAAYGACRTVLKTDRDHVKANVLCFLSSCGQKNEAQARKYYARLPAGHRDMMRQLCRKHGLNLLAQ